MVFNDLFLFDYFLRNIIDYKKYLNKLILLKLILINEVI